MPISMLTTALVGLGCGGGGVAQRAGRATSPSTAVRTVRSAAASTLRSGAGVRFTLNRAQAFGSSEAPVLGTGEFDFRSGRGSESIDLGEVGNQEPGNEQVVFLPSQVYLQPKSLKAAVLPKGKEWMSATLTGSESVNTNFPSFALQVEGVNPQFLLAQIAAGAVAATPAGPQASAGHRGERAYDVTVDLAHALGALTGPAAAAFGQAIQSELAASGGSTQGQRASITAWIDGGHVVRMRAAPPGAGVGTATMTMCCFGSAVEVAAPTPEQVVDIASLTPSGERENNGGGDSDGG